MNFAFGRKEEIRKRPIFVSVVPVVLSANVVESPFFFRSTILPTSSRTSVVYQRIIFKVYYNGSSVKRNGSENGYSWRFVGSVGGCFFRKLNEQKRWSVHMRSFAVHLSLAGWSDSSGWASRGSRRDTCTRRRRVPSRWSLWVRLCCCCRTDRRRRGRPAWSNVVSAIYLVSLRRRWTPRKTPWTRIRRCARPKTISAREPTAFRARRNCNGNAETLTTPWTNGRGGGLIVTGSSPSTILKRKKKRHVIYVFSYRPVCPRRCDIGFPFALSRAVFVRR